MEFQTEAIKLAKLKLEAQYPYVLDRASILNAKRGEPTDRADRDCQNCGGHDYVILDGALRYCNCKYRSAVINRLRAAHQVWYDAEGFPS